MIDVKKTIGLNIKYARKQRGLTQCDLAKISGLRQAYISEVERGNINITVMNIFLISKSLNAPITTFFENL